MAETRKQKRIRLTKEIEQYEQAIKQDVQTVKTYAFWGTITLITASTVWTITKNLLSKKNNSLKATNPQVLPTPQPAKQNNLFITFLQKKITNFAINFIKEKAIERLKTFSKKKQA